ncbi:hypothetical protein D9613_006803 [Agrocybe pediades]|uniref:ADF-H domain-containing protein n=1 Tax=Agrocybe pediades TaxID=84607 RepID=A0A8H4QHW9_9AGAR|nr:hypothetical protein D9613_006803 [Agrocybe pediades]KAF9561481.1 hypothetical protein CPC08DRAFT_707308 [Agrocybe pediades]
MALNIYNPEIIMSVYSSVLCNENNWLLLHYSSDSSNELVLHSYGRRGLEELKTKLYNSNQVFFAFYRLEEVNISPGFAIVTYIPLAISGVKRARALTHSRRVATIFKKHQAVLNIESLSQLNEYNIRRAIANSGPVCPPSPNHEGIQYSEVSSALHEKTPAIPPTSITALLRPLKPLQALQFNKSSPTLLSPRKSFTTMYSPETEHSKPPPVPPLPKGGGSLFSSLLRRKKSTKMATREELPPPTPPKDVRLYSAQPVALSRSLPPSAHPAIRHKRSLSMSDFAVISHAHEAIASTAQTESIFRADCYTLPLPLKGKWSQDGALPNNPAERARRRQELKAQREKEEREAIEEEAARQHRLKLEREALLRQEMEEEEQRKYEIEQEIRRITAERKRKEQIDQEEEEHRRQELETRKRMDRERRLEEHRRLEEWRKEQAKKEGLAARRAAEARKKEEEERKKKIQQVEARVKRNGNSIAEQTGWMTILNKDSLSWKRRFYKVKGNSLFLYRSEKDSTTVEEFGLCGKVQALKEWSDGYEDLEAIAYSFVVEFNDGDYWSMYADSEEEKYVILGLLKIAAGL